MLRNISIMALVLSVGAALWSATARGGDIFVGTAGDGTISEYTTSGEVVNAPLISGLNGPYGIAVSGSNLFVTNEFNGTLGEYTTDGATVNASLISGFSWPQGIAVSGSDLFVTDVNRGTISEYTTSGAVVNAPLISGLNGSGGIAVTGDVPEPSSLALLFSFLAAGTLGLIGHAWRRRRAITSEQSNNGQTLPSV